MLSFQINKIFQEKKSKENITKPVGLSLKKSVQAKLQKNIYTWVHPILDMVDTQCYARKEEENTRI